MSILEDLAGAFHESFGGVGREMRRQLIGNTLSEEAEEAFLAGEFGKVPSAQLESATEVTQPGLQVDSAEDYYRLGAANTLLDYYLHGLDEAGLHPYTPRQQQ